MASRRSSVANYVASHGDPGRQASIIPTEKGHTLNQHDETFRKMSLAVPNLAELTQDAKTAADAEKAMSLWTALKMYPTAIFFSFGLSLAVIMEGYDTWLLGSFWALPAFAKKYGDLVTLDGKQTYVVSANWQTAFGVAVTASQVLGLMINGIVSEPYGYRKTMMGALVAITCFLFVTFFSVNIQMLFAGYILSGLPWGVFQTLTTTYAAEVVPVALRAYLTTYVNLCWVIGQLLASGILKGFLQNSTEWAYRIPYAIQWIWPIPIFIVVVFAPESPWWLVRRGRIEDARTALIRLRSKSGHPGEIEETLAMIIHTNELEMQQSAGTSYLQCFRNPVDRRRTELTIMTWLIQQTSGSPMIGWGTYFMTQVGLTEANAYSLGVAQSAMGFVGTVGSWFLMPQFGRRTLYLWGQVVMFAGLMAIGGLGVPKLAPATGWGIGALMLVLTFIYDLTVGPVCYSLVAELPSSRLRIKTVVLARNVYQIAGMITGVLQPRFMNPTAWNWGGKTAFFWGGVNLLGLLWTYFRLPEPKGLTYADMDILFENKISARDFRKVEIDPFRSDHFVVQGETSGYSMEKLSVSHREQTTS